MRTRSVAEVECRRIFKQRLQYCANEIDEITRLAESAEVTDAEMHCLIQWVGLSWDHLMGLRRLVAAMRGDL